MKTLFESLIDDDEPPPDLQTIRRWIGDAKKESATAERARIREELLAEIMAKRSEWGIPEKGHHSDREIGATTAFAAVLGALDRICPEEPA